MNSILERILQEKKREVGLLRKSAAFSGKRTDARRPFAASLHRLPRLSVIAEVKKASPSRGVICEDFDPLKIASLYRDGGADAVSVLTDEKFFQGHTDYLCAVREHLTLPVLRKDFIIDCVQLEQTASINADAVLLIAAALDQVQLRDLFEAAGDLDLEPFVEIHSLAELDRVMKLEPTLLGVNNRDLLSFVTDISVSIEIVKHIPADVTVISESGISDGFQALTLLDAGVKGLLVGESLMRSSDPVSLIRELNCSGQR